MNVWEKLPEWMRTNVHYRSKIVASGKGTSSGQTIDHETDRSVASVEEANIISSDTGAASHYPAIDIDFPAALVPSSTEGHFHLYLKKELTWMQYERLLTVMAECGILQQGVLNSARQAKNTCLRLPHIKKGIPQDDNKD